MTESEGKQARPQRSLRTVDANSEIGRKLKSYYDTVANEPVPEVFLSLLEKLDEAERKAKSSP